MTAARCSTRRSSSPTWRPAGGEGRTWPTRGRPCGEPSRRTGLHRGRRAPGRRAHGGHSAGRRRVDVGAVPRALVGAGRHPGPGRARAGDRLGVILPDGATVHTAFLAAEKAGLVVVGVGARAGAAEMRHLLAPHRGDGAGHPRGSLGGRPADELVASLRVDGVPGLRHIVVPDVLDLPDVAGPGRRIAGRVPPAWPGRPACWPGRALGPDDLFMINSTSGTTGLPKCVLHTENRWFYFHQLAAAAGDTHLRRRLLRRRAGPLRLRPVDGALLSGRARLRRPWWRRGSTSSAPCGPSWPTGSRCWPASAPSSS